MTRLLIADDHPFILAGIQAILRDSAFQIVGSFPDGQALIDAVPLHRPDLLLVDVSMPRLSGVDVVRTLRDRGERIPVILFTASLDDRRLSDAYALGVEGIVLKESAQAQLLKCLVAVRDGGKWIEPALAARAAPDGSCPADADPRLELLSPSEREVAALVALGLRNREISTRLGKTEGTIKVYLHRIYEKCGVGNRTELAMLAAPRNE